MKNLVFLLIILFSCSLLAAPPPTPPMTVEGSDITFHGNVTIFGNVYGAVSKTKQDDTYYVRAGGDDNNTCLTVGDPCATPQGAVDKVPDFVEHVIDVDIGSGTFPAFAVYNKIIKPPGSLTVHGVLAAATLASGGNTGTFTAGVDNWTCQTGGETWTVNDLRGRILRQNSVPPVYSVIRSNTATNITFTEESEITCGAPSYDILDHDTIINGVLSAELPVTILVQSVRNSISDYTVNFPIPDSMMLRDLSAYNPTTAAIGVAVFGTYGTMYRMRSEAVYYGYSFMGDAGFASYDCYATGNGYAGFNYAYHGPASYSEGSYSYNNAVGLYAVFANGYYLFQDFCTEGGGSDGVVIDKSGIIELEDTIIDNPGRYGVNVVSTQKLTVDGSIDSANIGVVIDVDVTGVFGSNGSNVFLDGLVISNSVGDAIEINHSANLHLRSMSGAGNGGYGLRASHGAKVVCNGIPTIVGASGDFTVNEGDTAQVWADCGANDSVINVQNGTCVMGETQ